MSTAPPAACQTAPPATQTNCLVSALANKSAIFFKRERRNAVLTTSLQGRLRPERRPWRWMARWSAKCWWPPCTPRLAHLCTAKPTMIKRAYECAHSRARLDHLMKGLRSVLYSRYDRPSSYVLELLDQQAKSGLFLSIYAVFMQSATIHLTDRSNQSRGLRRDTCKVIISQRYETQFGLFSTAALSNSASCDAARRQSQFDKIKLLSSSPPVMHASRLK